MRIRSEPQKLVWWGEAPEQLYDFDEGVAYIVPASGYPNAFAEPWSIV